MINIVKKIYIITGANGFLGNNIIRKLEQDADNEIRAFVLNGDSIKSLEKLSSTKPTITKNQGDRIMIFVARDVDFSNVYQLMHLEILQHQHI